MWYPYVQIPVDPKVTTVVGANESGKSHLLTAIEKGISGEGIEREDFCRYSQFFTLERGKLKLPDFGFEWANLSEAEQQSIRNSCNIPSKSTFDRFFLFRSNQNSLTIYLSDKEDGNRYEVKQEFVDKFWSLLPTVFKINASIALPESVPIRALAGEVMDSDRNRLEALARPQRFKFFQSVLDLSPHLNNQQSITNSAAHISSVLSPHFSISPTAIEVEAIQKRQAEIALAQKLICTVAKVDPEALSDLYKAIQNGKEGHANGIIQKINEHLNRSLNFPNWWAQDRNFRIVVSPREYDLVFTIRDRTETEYSFGERSSGLKYFLSYYVQYRAHEPLSEAPEILLMDEPDAYLSSQAQQDLLKIFTAFANPEDEKPPVQVIYVTHSPFLIDKNHAERIRVLEKGVGEEGTRVVKDAAKNHYEPLRSAFGAFVGETTFIGNCNLMVEGAADQILIAGAATHLRSCGVSNLETLDLNHVTIVPASSASHIPYLVYLARGRDIEQPAVIVLLDSDSSGDEAKRKLKKGGPHRKLLLKENFIFQIGDLTAELPADPSQAGFVEIEDLIPLPICIKAAQIYLKEICGAEDSIVSKMTEKLVVNKIQEGGTIFDAIQASFNDLSEDDLHIEKIGFARNVTSVVAELYRKSNSETAYPPELETFETRFKALFRRLDKMRREAERELTKERVSQRVNRARKSFLQDHPTTAKREEAYVLLDELESSLDDSAESDQAKLVIQRIRREFALEVEMSRPVDNYEKLKEELEMIKYAGRIATQEMSEEMQP